jgi:DNA-binding NtrC family response regulator
VDYFARRVCEKLTLKYDGISEDSIKILQGMNWAGNVRELRNLVETMITLEQATYITPDILRRHIAPALPPGRRDPLASEVSLIPLRDYAEPRNIELELIFRTLLEIKNDITDLRRYFITLNAKLEDLKDKVLISEPIISISDEKDEEKFGEDILRLEDMEKQLITVALNKYNGNRRQAANALGISERTLYRKLDDYGIEN